MRAVLLAMLSLVLALPAQAQRVPDPYLTGQVSAGAVYPRLVSAAGSLGDIIIWADSTYRSLYQPATMTLTGAGGGTGAAAFTGMGDTLSGAKFHGGVIAYSNAQKNAKALSLCNGGVCSDVNFVNGFVSNAPVINGSACDNSGHICHVDTVYDDTGGTFCGSTSTGGTATCDLQQTTDSQRPVFVTSCIGSLPCLQCTSAANSDLASKASHGLPSMSQPISEVAAYSTPSTPASNQAAQAESFTFILGVDSSRKAFYYNGAVLSSSGTLTTNTFYSIAGTNTGSSNGKVAVNGTVTSGSVGNNSFTGPAGFDICNNGGGNKFDGNFLEGAIYAQTLADADMSNLSTTMRANGGY